MAYCSGLNNSRPSWLSDQFGKFTNTRPDSETATPMICLSRNLAISRSSAPRQKEAVISARHAPQKQIRFMRLIRITRHNGLPFSRAKVACQIGNAKILFILGFELPRGGCEQLADLIIGRL